MSSPQEGWWQVWIALSSVWQARTHNKGLSGRVKLTKPQEEEEYSANEQQHNKKDFKNIECFNAIGRDTTLLIAHTLLCSIQDHSGSHRSFLLMKHDVMEGRSVKDILLDLRCSRNLVHQDLVP